MISPTTYLVNLNMLELCELSMETDKNIFLEVFFDYIVNSIPFAGLQIVHTSIVTIVTIRDRNSPRQCLVKFRFRKNILSLCLG